MIKRKQKETLVAHITDSGIHSLEIGAIQLPDSRLDGAPGTLLLQLEAPKPHGSAMVITMRVILSREDPETALQLFDALFTLPGIATVTRFSSGNATDDQTVLKLAEYEGYELESALIG